MQNDRGARCDGFSTKLDKIQKAACLVVTPLWQDSDKKACDSLLVTGFHQAGCFQGLDFPSLMDVQSGLQAEAGNDATVFV